MEQKLYYNDAYLNSFSAKLQRQSRDESGNWFVILDQTAFYPTGGGQPHDTGTLNDIQVVNVEEMDGEVRHYIEKPLPETTDEIFGVIDWNHRFDHMQQHAGQHILSAAFAEIFGYETIGFHLGKETLTIDLNTDDLREEEADRAEELANQVILENRSIEPKWVTAAELSNYPLRKLPKVTEDIRLVIIPEFDYNGCGGTHPNTTGQVGSIKILDWERQKKKIRVQFVCGQRVLNQLGQKQRVLKELSPLLNAPEADMITALQKLLQTVRGRDRELEETKDILLQFEAKELVQTESLVNGHGVIHCVYQNRSIQELQKLGRIAASEAAETVILLISENMERLQVVCARGDARQESMKKLIGELLPGINGKGGGNDAFAQGGGDAVVTGEELLEKALGLL